MLDVVTTLNILQRAGMTGTIYLIINIDEQISDTHIFIIEKYLLPVNKLTLRLSGHYVARLCGQWATEVALLYLSVPSASSSSHYQGVLLDSSIGVSLLHLLLLLLLLFLIRRSCLL